MHEIKKANVTHLWSVLCQSATIDAETNDLTLIKTIDELSATFPNADALRSFQEAAARGPVTTPTACDLVTLWKKIDRSKDAVFELRVRFEDADGRELGTADVPVRMGEGETRHRHRLHIPGLPMTTVGEYGFVIEARTGKGAWERVDRVPVDVAFRLEQQRK